MYLTLGYLYCHNCLMYRPLCKFSFCFENNLNILQVMLVQDSNMFITN